MAKTCGKGSVDATWSRGPKPPLVTERKPAKMVHIDMTVQWGRLHKIEAQDRETLGGIRPLGPPVKVAPLQGGGR